MTNDVAAPKAQNPLVQFKSQLDQRADQFRSALPAHMPPERFQRVILTAVQNNPELLAADRQSLFNSAMRCAQDGLLPDGREAALVIFNTKEKTKDESGKVVERWVKKVQYMPMVAGIQKKARNSGELSAISAFVVLKADTYRRWVDENGEHLNYEPAEDRPHVTAENARQHVRSVFAMARTKDGETFVEVMSVDEVERVRSVSRAKDGSTWSVWWGEMAKKTVIRRLAKRLPMSSDLDDLIRRDDELYDLGDSKKTNGVLDLSGDDVKQIGGPSEPPTSSADGDRGLPDNGARPGGSDAASPSADTMSTKDEGRASIDEALERSIADTLIDCKTLRDCDGVKKLFAKELFETNDQTRVEVERMIDKRKAEIKADPDYFPGDER